MTPATHPNISREPAPSAILAGVSAGAGERIREISMIISRAYARKLVRADKAIEGGMVADPRCMGEYLVIVDRYDLCCVAHYEATLADVRRWSASMAAGK